MDTANVAVMHALSNVAIEVGADQEHLATQQNMVAASQGQKRQRFDDDDDSDGSDFGNGKERKIVKRFEKIMSEQIYHMDCWFEGLFINWLVKKCQS